MQGFYRYYTTAKYNEFINLVLHNYQKDGIIISIMNLNKLLLQKKCVCGKTHTCNIDYVAVSKNAVYKLKKLTSNYKDILIVLDDNTYHFAGEVCKKALKNRNVRFKIISTSSPLIPNEETANAVNLEIKSADLIIGVGSGVIQDLCKYVSFKANLPYFIIPTAPSMDGYASSTAIMTFGGVKTSVSAHPPKAILADVNLLKNAPLKMIQSGYGDVLGKISALSDWKLANIVIGEDFCPTIYDLTKKSLKRVLKLTKQLKKRRASAIKMLMEALLVTGISMSYLESSRSASGSEHLLSHFFEDLGMIKGEKYLPHGIDVAYSTYVTSLIRKKLIKAKLPTSIYTPNREDFIKNMNSMFEKSASKLIKEQDEFDATIEMRALSYKKLKSVKKILKQASNPKKIRKYLQDVGLDIQEFYNTYSKDKIEKAVIYAKNVRTRFTVLHLYLDTFNEKPLQ